MLGYDMPVALRRRTARGLVERCSLQRLALMPDSCRTVDIARSLLTIGTPEFIARWYANEGPCPDVVRLNAYQEVFHVGGKREAVKLHHEGGDVVQP